MLDTGADIVQLSVDHRVATHRQERHRLEGTGALVAPIDVSGAWLSSHFTPHSMHGVWAYQVVTKTRHAFLPCSSCQNNASTANPHGENEAIHGIFSSPAATGSRVDASCCKPTWGDRPMKDSVRAWKPAQQMVYWTHHVLNKQGGKWMKEGQH